MKNVALLIGIIFIVQISFAQNVTLKHDTIFADKTPYAIFKKAKTQPARYAVFALGGTELMELHSGRINVKGKPGYVVTFLSDHKQGMVIKDGNFPLSFLNVLVKYNLISKGMSVNAQTESEFIKAHPLPDGYTDVEQFVDDQKDWKEKMLEPK